MNFLVLSLDSVSAQAEDYKFENEKDLGVSS